MSMPPQSAPPDGGPLRGIRVLDLSALGPGPFCSMLLADFGAEVIAVERPSISPFDPSKYFSRGKRSAVIDLRAPGGADTIARLADSADVLIESNRPGTLERRGLGPETLCARNPGLIYTRLTGWGQDGPYRGRAGHDITYLAISGALGVLGGEDGSPPSPPLGLIGDLAGGSLFAAMGILMALFERNTTGLGQVIDAAIVDGAALLNTPQLGELSADVWPGPGRHVLSGAAPFYGVYTCSDGGHFAIGAIEPKFYAAMLNILGLDDLRPSEQLDARQWKQWRSRIAEVFLSKPRAHWSAVFADVDACGAPVVELDELINDAHLRERGTVVRDDLNVVAAPAPRLSRTAGRRGPAPAGRGADTRLVLLEAGLSSDEVNGLIASGTVFVAD